MNENVRQIRELVNQVLDDGSSSNKQRKTDQTGRPDQDLAVYITPVDWDLFWSAELPEQRWLIEPIIPVGRQVALYSVAKQGKSLLALDLAAAAATGRPILGQPPVEPFDVVYIDQEQTEGDIRERLDALGYGPNDDLSKLHYYLLTSLPPLNTELGGAIIEAIVCRFEAMLLVLDTMTRMVTGKENENDPIRDFYRHTGMRLKTLGCSLLRLDHAGKDLKEGQRGGSEKSGDVDVVFELRTVQREVILKRTHSRVPWVPASVILQRREEPVLAHILGDMEATPKVREVMRDLALIGVPVEVTAASALNALREKGLGHRKQDVLTAVKVRKAKAIEAVPELREPSVRHFNGNRPEP